MVEANALSLVIYKENPKSVLDYLSGRPPTEAYRVLHANNPKASAVFRHIEAYWEAHGEPPSYAALSEHTGYSVNSCVLYVKLLRDIGLLKRVKGKGGHKDIVPWNRRSRRSAAYVLWLWAKEFPDHPLASISRKIYNATRGHNR